MQTKCRYLPAAVGTFGPGRIEILYPEVLFGSVLIFDTAPGMANFGSTAFLFSSSVQNTFDKTIVYHV